MSGLIEKDLRLLLQRKQTVLIFLGLAVMLSFTQGGTFIIGYLTFLALILAVSTISYDEFDNGYPFLMTLPITSKIYVLEKYVFSLISTLVCWLVATVLCFVTYTVQGVSFSVVEELVAAGSILLIPFILMDIMIPMQIKFGSEKSRVVMLLVAGVCFVIAYGMKEVVKIFGIDWMSILQRMDQIPLSVIYFAIFVFVLILTWISVLISNHIMEHKEY